MVRFDGKHSNNEQRPHSSLEGKTPNEIAFDCCNDEKRK